jgi:lysyl-tRNA synthetase class I
LGKVKKYLQKCDNCGRVSFYQITDGTTLIYVAYNSKCGLNHFVNTTSQGATDIPEFSVEIFNLNLSAKL